MNPMNSVVATLTEAQVRHIRTPGCDIKQTAIDYGIPDTTVRRILHGKYCSWFNATIPPLTKEDVAFYHKTKRAYDRDTEQQQRAKERATVKPQDTKVLERVQKERHERAMAEGGPEKLQQLERRLLDHKRLSEPEWELLTRLRVGLNYKRFNDMMRHNVHKSMLYNEGKS